MEEEVSTFWHWLVAAVITPVAVAISAFFGGWTAAMTTLVTVMVLDIVSGLARAFVQKQVSSNVSWNGMVKKSLVFVIVALAARLDTIVGAGSLLKDATVTFFIVSEALSVLENTAAAGLPIPEFLRQALKQLNEKKAAPENQNGQC